MLLARLVLGGLDIEDYGAVNDALPIQIIMQPPLPRALRPVLLSPAEVRQFGLLRRLRLDPRGDGTAVGHVGHQEAHVRAVQPPDGLRQDGALVGAFLQG